MTTEQPPTEETMAHGGLLNMGNTCYANAVLQCFRHCPRIPWIFERGRYSQLLQDAPAERRRKQQELVRSFGDVIGLLQACKRGQSVRPSEFWAKFRGVVEGTGFEHLAARIPHDSHEFMLALLDTLHEGLSQEVEMKILRPPPTTERERHCVAALETWRREFQKTYSPLVDLFYGLLQCTVECQRCHAKSHRWETFTALKGSFPKEGGGNPLTLTDLLREEFKPEPISDYVCEACAPTRTDAVRTVRIWRMPVYPVVVLKRFSYDGRKISKPIAPVPTDPITFEEFMSSETTQQTDQAYRLYGVVDHHGILNGGHYTAQARAAGSSAWQLYDDESVHGLGSGPAFGASTYMLWFERVRPTKAVAVSQA